MQVLMLDDHEMFLQGLKNLLGTISPGLQIDISSNVAHAAQLTSLRAYDLVLLDWHLADCDGAEAMQRLRDVGCAARIVVLSGETSTALIRRTVELGAAGFIPKTYSSEMLVSALDKVLGGRVFLPAEGLATAAVPPTQTDLEHDPRFAGLTSRQIDVYRAAARGLPNKLIARELGIAESTVKTHLSAVFAQLGVRNRTEAAFQASRDGLRIA